MYTPGVKVTYFDKKWLKYCFLAKKIPKLNHQIIQSSNIIAFTTKSCIISSKWIQKQLGFSLYMTTTGGQIAIFWLKKTTKLVRILLIKTQFEPLGKLKKASKPHLIWSIICFYQNELPNSMEVSLYVITPGGGGLNVSILTKNWPKILLSLHFWAFQPIKSWEINWNESYS